MPRWTPEARLRQSEKIREWQPWQQSTGPRSQEGKAVASRNRFPRDFIALPIVGITRSDTKRGKQIFDAVVRLLSLRRLGLISDTEFEQESQYILRKFGYTAPQNEVKHLGD